MISHLMISHTKYPHRKYQNNPINNHHILTISHDFPLSLEKNRPTAGEEGDHDASPGVLGGAAGTKATCSTRDGSGVMGALN